MGSTGKAASPEGKILALGELLVDLVPAREHMRIRDTGPVLKTASGSAGIFACAAARLGAPVGFIGKVGRDPLSRMVTEAIRQEGVDTGCLAVSEEGQIGLAFLEYTETGRNYEYYRSDSVGSRLSPGDVREECIARAYALHFPGMLLELNESMRETCFHAARLAGKHGALLSFDPNIRLEIAHDSAAKARLLEMVRMADILSPTLAEGRRLTGRDAPGEVLVSYWFSDARGEPLTFVTRLVIVPDALTLTLPVHIPSDPQRCIFHIRVLQENPDAAADGAVWTSVI